MKDRTTRHNGFDGALVNADIGVLDIVARYANQIFHLNTNNRVQYWPNPPQTLPYRHLYPVGRARMPSQSVHFPEQLYEYIISTKGEDQSTSARIAELVEKGKQMEATND